jgi:hypothetical protein
LEAKRLRHHPKLDEILPEGIQKSQGRKLSKIQGLLNEILDSRQLARSLDIDTWIITRLTLSSNERICCVWWKLDSSIPETRHAEQNVLHVLIVGKNIQFIAVVPTCYPKGYHSEFSSV